MKRMTISAVIAIAPAAVMLALKLLPPQSLHLVLMRLCWQMLVPPQSLQVPLRWLCWQMVVSPQSLQVLLARLCSHFLRVPFPCAASLSLPPPFPPASRLPLYDRIVGLLPRHDAVNSLLPALGILPLLPRGEAEGTFPAPRLRH